MNFRTCKYFLTVCEMGTINAAARKLYISQQSLSEHMRKLEKELGVSLFHRDNPLTLTEAGRSFYRTAADVMAALDRLDAELAVIKGQTPDTLIVGCMDYGTPDFLPALVDLFLKCVPNVLFQAKEIKPGETIPPEIPLLISARELRGYKCENLFTDRLVICVHDGLLQRQYGAEWLRRRERLASGDLHAIGECPFIRHRNTPLELLSELVFEKNDFHPSFLPVSGSTQAMTHLCASGQGAMITFLGQTQNMPGFPPAYSIPNVPETIPTSFICYRIDTELPEPARRFLEITRQYFKRREFV